MTNRDRERLITAYLNAYNQFDVAGMLEPLHPDIEFAHISQGTTTIQLQGITHFEKQARQVLPLFSSRRQSPSAFRHTAEHTTVGIAYQAVLAVDFSEVLQKGAALILKGESVFRFADQKIVGIMDIS